MIRIGRYEFGLAPVSMVVVFIVLSTCALITAFHQSRPDWTIPLSHRILINESIALLATLVYGIFIHFIIALIHRNK